MCDVVEFMEVVGDVDKGEDKKYVFVMSFMVFLEDVEYFVGIFVMGYYVFVRVFVEEVEEVVGGMVVVVGVGEEGELMVVVGC